MRAGSIARTVSVMRTALVGRPMVEFSARSLVGATPEAGRIVEAVESESRRVKVVWDDGLVLETRLARGGEWHVYRHGEPWRRTWNDAGIVISTDDFVAVCFAPLLAETYPTPDRSRHPGFGGIGPDIGGFDVDVEAVADRLRRRPDASVLVADAVVDPRVMSGAGNVERSEVLWVRQVSPWACVGDLTSVDAVLLVRTMRELVRARRSRRVAANVSSGLNVYGRAGYRCPRCPDTIRARPFSGRQLYWCASCQTWLDRRPLSSHTETQPGDAARTYLSE